MSRPGAPGFTLCHHRRQAHPVLSSITTSAQLARGFVMNDIGALSGSLVEIQRPLVGCVVFPGHGSVETTVIKDATSMNKDIEETHVISQEHFSLIRVPVAYVVCRFK